MVKCFRFLSGEFPTGTVGNTACGTGTGFQRMSQGRFDELGLRNYRLFLDGVATDRYFESVGVEEVPLAVCGGCAAPNPNLPPGTKYDCLNGGCIPKTTYNTPGVFDSLAACQSGCAKNSNCKGECIPAAEITALKAAANKLQSKFCK